MVLAVLLASAAAAHLAPRSCMAANAEPVTIAQIMDDPAGYEGRCVAVTALGHGVVLVSSVEDYYLAGPLAGGDPTDRLHLGVANLPHSRRIPRDGLHPVTAVGRLEICQRLHDMADATARAGRFGWVSGYCHMSLGPYLRLEDLRILRDRDRPTRLTGEANRARLGGLVPAPEDWPHRAFVEAQADQWLAALQARDRAGFARLHLAGEPEAEEAARLAFGRHRGFADLRRASRPQRAIFVARSAGDEAEDYSSTICFCRSGDCSERWPISGFDADNHEDRPYVCTRFGPYVLFRRGTVPAFITRRSPHGLPEPRPTRR
jgi:hypothetical protein